jgi:flagellar protein FlaG
VDEDLGRIVVKVMDHETKEVIRQIPADEVLQLAKRLKEDSTEKGNLFTLEV